MTYATIRPVTIQIPSNAARNDSQPTYRLLPASELSQLPAHPLSDHFSYLPPYRIELLVEPLRFTDELSVTTCRGYVLDGRNCIVAGMLDNLQLRVDERDDLTEEQIQDLVFELNPHRLERPKRERIAYASNYFDIVRHTEHSVTLQRAANLYRVSKRSLCRYRKCHELLSITG